MSLEEPEDFPHALRFLLVNNQPSTSRIDDERLTFPNQGRDQRLTDVHGENEFTKLLLA